MVTPRISISADHHVELCSAISFYKYNKIGTMLKHIEHIQQKK